MVDDISPEVSPNTGFFGDIFDYVSDGVKEIAAYKVDDFVTDNTTGGGGGVATPSPYVNEDSSQYPTETVSFLEGNVDVFGVQVSKTILSFTGFVLLGLITYKAMR